MGLLSIQAQSAGTLQKSCFQLMAYSANAKRAVSMFETFQPPLLLRSLHAARLVIFMASTVTHALSSVNMCPVQLTHCLINSTCQRHTAVYVYLAIVLLM